MPLIAVDHSANLEDGLYTGEECVMRDESWDLEDGLYTGEEVHIEPVLVSREGATLTSERRTEMNRTHLDDACGVEVELNLESLSYRGDVRDHILYTLYCTMNSLEQPEDTAIEEPARRSTRRRQKRRNKLSIIRRQLVAKGGLAAQVDGEAASLPDGKEST
ncbi:hypothetical protein ACHAXT_004872 [Thalassiosira profunda]